MIRFFISGLVFFFFLMASFGFSGDGQADLEVNRFRFGSPILLAQSNRTRRIQFARGANQSVIEDAVIRGTRDIYLVRANATQTMTVSLTSPDNNAVFALLTPQGELVEQEATNSQLVLPLNGDYQIIVGGTRGNASYRLEVRIN